MRISARIVIATLLLVAIGIEALASVEWATYPYFPDKTLLFARADATVFSLLAPFSPALLLTLLYIWFVKLAVSFDNRVSKRLKSFLTWLAQPLSYLKSKTSSATTNAFVLVEHPRILLLVALASALLLGLVPYRPELNPMLAPVGVDTHYYIEWVNQMLQRSPAGAFSYAMGNASFGSRPLLLLTMYLAVSTGMITATRAAELLPAVLGPLFVLSSFFFVREGRRDEKMAGVAALFSAFSFEAVVGIWAGFYANWLALSEAFVFLGLLMGFFRTRSTSKYILLIVASISILLTHPWTWAIALTIGAIFVASIWRDARKIVLIRPLLLFLAINIVVDVTKSLIFGGPLVAQDVSSSLSGSGGSLSPGFWPNIISALFVYFNGLLGNVVVLGFSLIAVIYIGFRDHFERLLTFWMVVGSLLFPLFDGGGEARVIYELPFGVLTTIGLLTVIRPRTTSSANSNLALVLVLLLSANFALRATTALVVAPF